MKKKFLFLAAVLAAASACVDDGFDLSEVDTDDIVIGSDKSTFKVPLANITVKADAIQGDDSSLESILKDADLLISGRFDKLDLHDLPADALVESLFDALRGDGNLRREVGEFLQGGRYRSEIVQTLPPDLQGIGLDEVFSDHFDALYQRQELRDAMKNVIGDYLGSINDRLPSVSVKMYGIGIDEDLIGLLTGTGGLRLYGTVSNKMPLDGTAVLRLVKNDGSAEEFLKLELVLDYTEASRDFSVDIDDEVLRALAGDMQMHVALDLASYYPGKPLADADGTVLELALKLEKQGGLNIGDLFDGDILDD